MSLRRFAVLSLAALFPCIATQGFAQGVTPLAIEFYHAGFDHYFMTSQDVEIQALDSGATVGWTRTGRAFRVFAIPPGSVDASEVCRFYIPPQHGDSHFFSAFAAECAAILAKIGVDPNYSGYIEESPNVFYVFSPNAATGVCPFGAAPVYRLWNQRADSNHRYTTDPGIKAAMIAKGYAPEGYGPDAVAMCTQEVVLVDALTTASGASGYAAGCDGVPATGIVYINAEVEPSVAVNPANANNVIGVWQQDRWSNGGARGLGTAYSFDGGGTWTRTSVPFSRCTGGNAGNGGNFERNSDPWVSFGPDGTAHQIALAFNNQANGNNAILASRSTDGGRTWSTPATLRSDSAASFNDKESITADPFDARFVYATWDRLTGNNGPTWLARSTDGGATWEAARSIYDPGTNSQTINNQIVVLPDGTLIDFFTELASVGAPNPRLRLIRSADKGVTWSPPITISDLQSVGTVDPETGTGIRDGSAIASFAAGRNGVLAAAWQDSRFAGGAYDGVAFSRSLDGGATWSAPIRINGAPASPALLPAVTIQDSGTYGVAYYDLRSNTSDPNTLPTDTWLVSSSDGVRWSERRVAPGFDFAKAPLAGGFYFLGDYFGITQTADSFLPFFGRTNADPDNRDDIALGILRVPSAAAPAREVVTGAAPGGPPSPAVAARIAAAVRAAVVQRLPEAVFKRLAPPAP